jgi:hypothetical protein
MCTLIVSFRQHDDWPVVVAANRDEALGRPATGPRRWPGERFVAPRDELAGGTWLGLTTSGLFVGVTNRFPAERHGDRRSRGALVVDALRAPDAVTLQARLARLDPREYNAFHLLLADRDAAFVTWSDGQALQQQPLAPGLHVVTERSLGGDDRSRVELARRLWPASSPPAPGELMALLGTTRPDDPLGGLCVEAPAFDYGTRSSAVLLLNRELGRSRLFWAEGRPDRTPFVERPDLVAALI